MLKMPLNRFLKLGSARYTGEAHWIPQCNVRMQGKYPANRCLRESIFHWEACLAWGLKRNRSIDGGSCVKTLESNHGKTSVLDFSITSPGKGFFALSGSQVEGIEKSRNHVLYHQTKSIEDI